MHKNMCISLFKKKEKVFNTLQSKFSFQMITYIILLHIWIFVWVYSLIFTIG